MRIEEIPTNERMGRGLIRHDPRSKDYPARRLIDPAVERRSRTWRRGEAYDQGQTSTCVSQTGKGLLNTDPFSDPVPYDIRSEYAIRWLQKGAKGFDEWEGRRYQGTSGLGLCEFLKDRGVIAGYLWCFTVDDIIDTLVQWGPVGLGAMWRTGMQDTDAEGILTVSGDTWGGHQTELFGWDDSRELVIGMNSWGEGWGDRGRFLLSPEDLGLLMADSGDAFTLDGVNAPSE